MRVRTLLEHRDHDDRTRHPGEVYDTEPDRAGDLHRANFIENLDRAAPAPTWDIGNEYRGGRILTPWPVASQYDVAPEADSDFKVLQLTLYDPGSAGYRYHSAINTVSGQRSAFVRWGHSSPFCDLRQYDGERDSGGVSQLFAEADAITCHMEYKALEEGVRRWPDKSRQMLIRHYHGSDALWKPKDGEVNPHPPFMELDTDDAVGAVLIGARLWHNRYSARMNWLPIPMPCLDYLELRRRFFVPMEQRERKVFRLCHSPTHWRLKGTVALEHVVADMQMAGAPIELIQCREMQQGAALKLKASCDATFDSFWLGIQGSGLEAAAMGQPVLAGDDQVADDYRRFLSIEPPYTFVRDTEALRSTLQRLIEDPEFVKSEGLKVQGYVLEHHDYPKVGERFRGIIAEERSRRGL